MCLLITLVSTAMKTWGYKAKYVAELMELSAPIVEPHPLHIDSLVFCVHKI